LSHPCEGILVIEDDASIRELEKVALEFAGFHIHIAANGEEGLQLLQTVPSPCLILLDLMMPVMDGWEFVSRLECDPALCRIPVVVLTAFDEIGRPIRARSVLKKPVDIDCLFEIARHYCQLSKTA
jgi:CheY-like chemotaxis protein